MKPYPNEELDRMSKREIIRLYKRIVEQFNEAEPVRHGHWLENMFFIECSECGFTTDKMFREEMPHCPNCGARMDEDE